MGNGCNSPFPIGGKKMKKLSKRKENEGWYFYWEIFTFRKQLLSHFLLLIIETFKVSNSFIMASQNYSERV